MRASPLQFDDFTPGRAFTSAPRRVSRADIEAFTELSGDRTALHSDDEYARSTPLGGVVAHGALVLSAATGLAYSLGIFEGTVLAVRSMDVSFDRPVKPGDLVTLTLRVSNRDPRPRPGRGLVRFEVDLRNQHSRTVMSGVWALLVRRAPPQAPQG